MISDKDKEFLLSLKPEDLVFTKLVYIFGAVTKKDDAFGKVSKPRFKPNDKLILLPSEYFVKEKTETTVGRLIFNKYIVERIGLQSILGYVNMVLHNGNIGVMESKLSKALIEDRMTMKQYVDYINYRETLGMQLHSVISTSFTNKTIRIPPPVKKRKDELFKKYDKELNDGDIVIAEKIEKELVDMTKDYLQGDPGLDLYDSAAKGNFGNFKNMMIFKGATLNNTTGKYEIVRSAFMDGVQKQDIASNGDSVVSGAYPKAVGTQESGYLTKQLLAAMQAEVLDEKGSDCHTNMTIEIKLTDKDAKDFLYRYIVENGKYVCLTPEIIDKYIGKKINLRSPMYCVGDHICNICAGDLNYKLNNLNIGLGCPKISNTLLKLGMKQFHKSDLNSSLIDVDDMLI